MPICAIKKCKNRSGLLNLARGGVSYHRFPHDPNVKAKWISATGRPLWWSPSKTATICSQHFDQRDLLIKDGGRHYLNSDAVPSLNVYQPPGPVSSQDSAVPKDSHSSHNLKPQRTVLCRDEALSPTRTFPPLTPIFAPYSDLSHELGPSDCPFSSQNVALPQDMVTSIEVEIMPENKIIVHSQKNNCKSEVIQNNAQIRQNQDNSEIELMRAKIQEQELLIRKLKLRNYRLKKRLFSLKSMES